MLDSSKEQILINSHQPSARQKNYLYYDQDPPQSKDQLNDSNNYLQSNMISNTHLPAPSATTQLKSRSQSNFTQIEINQIQNKQVDISVMPNEDDFSYLNVSNRIPSQTFDESGNYGNNNNGNQNSNQKIQVVLNSPNDELQISGRSLSSPRIMGRGSNYMRNSKKVQGGKRAKQSILNLKQLITHSLAESKQSQLQSENQSKSKLKYTFVSILLLYTNVTSFTRRLLNIIKNKRALRALTEYQINCINDKGYVFQYQEGSKQYIRAQQMELNEKKRDNNVLYNTCVNILDKIPIIQPSQISKILFDCYVSYFIVFRMYFTTIKLFFFITNIRAAYNIVKQSTVVLLNISFMIDILLTLNTGYYDKGKIITDRKQIFVKYMSQTFIYDLLAQIPLFFTYAVQEDSNDRMILISYILEFFIFFKSVSLKKTFQRLERVVTEYQLGANLWPLVKLIVNVIVLAHIVGSCFFGLAQLQKELWDEGQTWIDTLEIEDKGWFHQYLYSVYWAFSTMVSNVVYQPITKTELLFSLVMIILMTGIFGYVLNTIGLILTEMEKQTKTFRLERERANRFLKKKQIPEKLRERVYLYLDYVQLQETTRNQQEEDLVLERLSDQLRREILQQINQKNLNYFTMIKHNFSDYILGETLLVIKEEVYSQGDIIYKPYQEEDNLAIYVVLKGVVEMYYERPGSIGTIGVGLVKQGHIFGNLEFFTGIQPECGAVAKEACSVIKINRIDFLQIVKNSVDDMETFMQIKDQVLQYNTSKQNVYMCQFCEEEGHQAHVCPRSHFIVDVKKLIYDYNTYDLQLQRTQYQRIDIRSHDAYIDIEDVQECIYYIQQSPENKEYIQQLQQIIMNGQHQIYDNGLESRDGFDTEHNDHMTNAIKLDLIQEEENDETMFKSGDLLTNNRNKSHSRSIILNSQNLEVLNNDRMGGRKRSIIRIGDRRNSHLMNNIQDMLLQDIINQQQKERHNNNYNNNYSNDEYDSQNNNGNNNLNINASIHKQMVNNNLSNNLSTLQKSLRHSSRRISGKSQHNIEDYKQKSYILDQSLRSQNLDFHNNLKVFSDYCKQSIALDGSNRTHTILHNSFNSPMNNGPYFNSNHNIQVNNNEDGDIYSYNTLQNIGKRNNKRGLSNSKYTIQNSPNPSLLKVNYNEVRDRNSSRSTNRGRMNSSSRDRRNSKMNSMNSSSRVNIFKKQSSSESDTQMQLGTDVQMMNQEMNNKQMQQQLQGYLNINPKVTIKNPSTTPTPNSGKQFFKQGSLIYASNILGPHRTPPLNGMGRMDEESLNNNSTYYQQQQLNKIQLQQQQQKYLNDIQFMQLQDFDKQKDWKIYFVEHNLSQIRKQEEFRKLFQQTIEVDSSESDDSGFFKLRSHITKQTIIPKKSVLDVKDKDKDSERTNKSYKKNKSHKSSRSNMSQMLKNSTYSNNKKQHDRSNNTSEKPQKLNSKQQTLDIQLQEDSDYTRLKRGSSTSNNNFINLIGSANLSQSQIQQQQQGTSFKHIVKKLTNPLGESELKKSTHLQGKHQNGVQSLTTIENQLKSRQSIKGNLQKNNDDDNNEDNNENLAKSQQNINKSQVLQTYQYQNDLDLPQITVQQRYTESSRFDGSSEKSSMRNQ